MKTLLKCTFISLMAVLATSGPALADTLLGRRVGLPVQHCPTDERAASWYKRAQFLYLNSNSKEAIAAYDKALSFDPSAASAYSGRGSCYLELQNWREAKRDFDKCVALECGNVSIYWRRAIARYHLGETKEALSDLDKAIELCPDGTELYDYRALVKFERGDTEGALADADQAVELSPKSWFVYEARSHFLARARQRRGALRDYLEARKLTGSTPNGIPGYIRNNATVLDLALLNAQVSLADINTLFGDNLSKLQSRCLN